MDQLPQTVQKAAALVGLPDFLENVPLGFHWDILDRLEEGVYLIDVDGRIMYWSSGAERITGYRAEEVLGARCSDNILNHVDESGKCLCKDSCPLTAAMVTGCHQAADVYLHHKNGHRVPVRVYGAPIRDSEGDTIGAFETFSETTALLGPLEKVRALEEIAYIDTLTGIGNRRLIEHELDKRFAEYRREGWRFGAVLLDVDHFKRFNDQHGHETGDRVLKMVADTVGHNCRAYDLVGRWGGEEFLIVSGHTDPGNLLKFVDRIRALVAASSLNVDSQSLQVTLSAGGAIVRSDDDPATLVARADELLYESKSNGRNRVTVDTVAESAGCPIPPDARG